MPDETPPETGTPATPPAPPAPATPPAPQGGEPEEPAKPTEPVRLPDDHPLVKAYADTKAKLRRREDAELDEQQRLARDLEEATNRGTTLEAENARLKAAIEHGLSAEDLDLLGSGTAEEIAERAKRLAERLGPQTRRPAPDPSQGNRGGTGETDVKTLIDSIPPTI